VRRVQLLVGVGARFGTGHSVRMRELRAGLEAGGMQTLWHELVAFDDASAKTALDAIMVHGSDGDRNALFVLDARDLNPRPFAVGNAIVLALDNRHASREKLLGRRNASDPEREAIQFYDTIPHPRADLSETLSRVLLGSDVRAIASSARPRKSRRSLFVYTGDFAVPGLDAALRSMLRTGWSVHRCGSVRPGADVSEEAVAARPETEDFGDPASRTVDPAPPGFRWSPRLERREFLRALAVADGVWTYFGMTLLEAWYLNRGPLLLPVDSRAHTELAEYLHSAAGVPIVEPAELSATLADPPEENKASALRRGPGDQGFDRLIARVRALAAGP
jgi:hypothetical protein